MKTDQQVRIVFFWLCLGASAVLGLVKYVDAQVAKSPWVGDKPLVMKMIDDGFKSIGSRLDRIDRRLEKALDKK